MGAVINLASSKYTVCKSIFYFLFLNQTYFVGTLSTQKIIIEPQHEISNNVVCATSKASDQPAHTGSLIRILLVC